MTRDENTIMRLVENVLWLTDPARTRAEREMMERLIRHQALNVQAAVEARHVDAEMRREVVTGGC